MKKDMTKKPFFARLLAQQERVAGGADATNKYPSDWDEEFVAPVKELSGERTLKYPSDTH